MVDNGSTDGTRAVAEAYGAATGQRVRCIEEPHLGKSHALNTGLAAVETELVITLDADTLLHPQAIRQLVARLLNARPTCRPSPGRCWSATAATTSGPACRNGTTSWGSLR